MAEQPYCTRTLLMSGMVQLAAFLLGEGPSDGNSLSRTVNGRMPPASVEAGQRKSRGREPRVRCPTWAVNTLRELPLSRELQMDVTQAVVYLSGVLLAAGSALGHRRALVGMSLKAAPLCPASGDAHELQSLHAISLTLASNCQQNFKVSRAAVRGTQCDYNLTSSSRCVAALD